MKKPPQKSDDSLPANEVHKREKDVLTHFLTTKPEPHKPLGGKNPQAKRRQREKREK